MSVVRLAGVTALSAALLPLAALRAQDASPPPTLRRIVMLTGSQPDLGPLRTAVRSADAAGAAAAVARFEDEVVRKRGPLVRAVADLGGAVTEHFWLVDGVVVEVPAERLDALRALPGVARVWEDAARAPGDAHLAPIRTSTNANNHGTDIVQARGVRGAGVTVAVLDSGLDMQTSPLTRPHSTFFVNGNPANPSGGGIGGSRVLANVAVGALTAEDPIDHGTRVAAVAAGAVWNLLAAADDGQAPDAHIVGYGLVDLMPGGITTVTTMTRAWQRCAAEAVLHRTKVAVISYYGSGDPLAPDQQAMDACADVADVAVAAMAGNVPGDQMLYVGANNVLAVGAVSHNAHVPTSFTARGPLQTVNGDRTYPQLVANGENIEMPRADFEIGSIVSSGTSSPAPQVAGAAALFRSVATTANADETRAAILATVDDARGGLTLASDVAAMGNGYLRVDRLIDLAQGRIPGLVTRGTTTLATPGWSTTFNATQNEVYAAVVAFARRTVSSAAIADLDIRVSQNGVPLAESSSPANNHERVVFRVPVTGAVRIDVFARSFEPGRVDQSFGLAVARASLPIVTTFGQGCPGAAGPATVQEVEPMSLFRPTPAFGNAASDLLLGGTPHRTQQWIDTSNLTAAFGVTGLAFRHDNGPGAWATSWVELDATVDLTTRLPSSMTTTFAQNLGRLATQVISRKRFVLPGIAAPNVDPNDFRVVLPLDQSFSRQYDALGNPPGPGGIHDLILDVRTWATSAGAQPLSYPLDAVSGFAGAVTLRGTSPTATTGTLMQGQATVVGLVSHLGSRRVPTIAVTGLPSIGTSYDVRIADAAANVPTFLTLGLSNTSNLGVALPLDLTLLGAPGCWLLTSIESTSAAPTTATGTAGYRIAIPNNAALRGGRLYHQALIADPLANALGVTTTAGIQAVVGR